MQLKDEFMKEYGKLEIETSQAAFGDISQRILNGTIIYDKANPTGCNRMNIMPENYTDSESLPIIALVDRGQCSFATKARNSDRSGASLLVIIDDRYENIHEVTMNDDGVGSSINIPSVLIDRYSGMIIKKYTDQNTTVTMNLEGVSQKTKIDMELWYSSNSEEALEFISSFSSYAE